MPTSNIRRTKLLLGFLVLSGCMQASLNGDNEDSGVDAGSDAGSSSADAGTPTWQFSPELQVDGGPHYLGFGVGSNGVVHTAYYETPKKQAQQLKYARYDGLAWHTETIEEPVGAYGAWSGENARTVAVAVDSQANPHVVYSTPRFSSGNGHIRYARRTAQGFATETLETFSVPQLITTDSVPSRGLALALDSADRPHICYGLENSNHYQHYNLVLSHFDGSQWQRRTVDAHATPESPRLRLDSMGQAHLAYRQITAGLNDPYSVVYLSPTMSVPEPIATSVAVLDMALNANDEPTILFMDMSKHYQLARRTPTGWVLEAVEASNPYAAIGSLAFAPSGALHLMYSTEVTISKFELFHSRWTGVGSISTSLTASANSGELQLDATGVPHLVFIDGRKIVHASYR